MSDLSSFCIKGDVASAKDKTYTVSKIQEKCLCSAQCVTKYLPTVTTIRDTSIPHTRLLCINTLRAESIQERIVSTGVRRLFTKIL